MSRQAESACICVLGGGGALIYMRRMTAAVSIATAGGVKVVREYCEEVEGQGDAGGRECRAKEFILE